MTIVLNTTIRPEILHGRGAVSNAVGRFEKQTRVLLDDGWDRSIGQPSAAKASGRATKKIIVPAVVADDGWDDGWRADDDAPPAIRTEVIHDATRTIIAHNKSPDISFDQSINPYRGCEHGCIYCFARPTHAYLGMSPGVDFESRLFAKPCARSPKISPAGTKISARAVSATTKVPGAIQPAARNAAKALGTTPSA